MSDKIIEIKESSAVQTHIMLLQGIINKLSDKSANCKNWCVGLMTAVFLFLFSSEYPMIQKDLSWMYYLPIFLFLFLNCYYLGQERLFVRQHNEFVDSINKEELDAKQIFIGKQSNENIVWYCRLLKKFGKDLLNTIGALFSFSIIIFYSASFTIMKMVLTYFINK